MLIEAQAPGKLVIVGEYAVLEGAPGLAVAVDVRAEARIATLTGNRNSNAGYPLNGNQLVIPDIGKSYGFRWVPESGPHWEGSSPRAFGLPLTACTEILYARGLFPRPSELPACRIELKSEAFHQTTADGQRVKLGLGSSAAIVVALTGVLLRFVGGPPLPRQDLIDICCQVHRRLQGGAGSGIDIATSLTGGAVAIEFSRPPGRASGPTPGQVAKLFVRMPQAHPVSWPRQLRLVAAWSGESASTPAMLRRLQSFREQAPAAFDGHMGSLNANASQAIAAWTSDDVAGLLTAIAGYESGLRRLDEAARIGIFSAAHERLRAIAVQHGAVYKPSGAGGGDFGIALTDSRDVERALRDAYAAAGIPTLDVELCALGLHVRTL
ncbi:MAG: hypothetical protein R3F24_14985 [Gammaproteobacteria bacterium]